MKCSLGHEADHLKREGLSAESDLPIYEYLSLALFKSATPALAWITLDHATALKATYKAGRRGGDRIARSQR